MPLLSSKAGFISAAAVLMAVIASEALAQSSNTAPVCDAKTIPLSGTAIAYVTSIRVSLGELQTCRDADGDELVVTSVSAPATITSDGFIAIPADNDVTVTYSVSDGHGGTATSTITLTLQ